MVKNSTQSSKLKVTYISIDELKENPNNARTHSEKQIHKIAKSIEKLGFNNPVLIDQNNMIIAGHGRTRAAKLLGIKRVPAISLDLITPEQVRAYIIADNKLAEEAGWDNEILKIELQHLMKIEVDFDATITGFDIPQIDIIINDCNKNNKEEKANKDDILPENSIIPQNVKKGDLWKLGDNYIFCGDALKKHSYISLLGDKKANMIFTDPPYNVKVDGHVCGSGKIKHKEFAMASGEMTSEQFKEFLETAFKNLTEYSTDGSLHFICMDWRHITEMMTAGNEVYSEFKNLCIWNKQQGGMGSLYRSQHELVFVFKNGTATHINNVELGKHGRYRTNVWDYRGVNVANPGSIDDLKLHPTVKPTAMIMDAILDCSKPNGIILDCFGGSGSTMLAAERTHRRAYVIEYEPHYCDVIIYRYEKLFDKKVELIANYTEVEVKNEQE